MRRSSGHRLEVGVTNIAPTLNSPILLHITRNIPHPYKHPTATNTDTNKKHPCPQTHTLTCTHHPHTPLYIPPRYFFPPFFLFFHTPCFLHKFRSFFGCFFSLVIARREEANFYHAKLTFFFFSSPLLSPPPLPLSSYPPPPPPPPHTPPPPQLVPSPNSTKWKKRKWRWSWRWSWR